MATTKKRIGIITYTHGTNFGQRLQNYALQTVLERYGFDVETIRQTSPLSTIRKLKISLKSIVQFILHPRIEAKIIRRKRLFSMFNERFIKFYSRVIHFRGDNRFLSAEFDAFIVGSDQIWSPNSIYVGDNAFLTFAKVGQKLTYAPSLSVDEMPLNKVEFYKKRLEDFKYISVREEKGKEILERITNKDITVVLDPTLLLSISEWDMIRRVSYIKPQQPYILAYFLGSIPRKLVESISEASGLACCMITDYTDMSPEELIDAIADSEVVLTDSFHGTIFSVIYQKQFLNYARSDNKFSMNSRFDTLYKILGIKPRIYPDSKIDYCSIEKIDYKSMEQKLNCEKEKSLHFLEKELCDFL